MEGMVFFISFFVSILLFYRKHALPFLKYFLVAFLLFNGGWFLLRIVYLGGLTHPSVFNLTRQDILQRLQWLFGVFGAIFFDFHKFSLLWILFFVGLLAAFLKKEKEYFFCNTMIALQMIFLFLILFFHKRLPYYMWFFTAMPLPRLLFQLSPLVILTSGLFFRDNAIEAKVI